LLSDDDREKVYYQNAAQFYRLKKVL